MYTQEERARISELWQDFFAFASEEEKREIFAKVKKVGQQLSAPVTESNQ